MIKESRGLRAAGERMMLMGLEGTGAPPNAPDFPLAVFGQDAVYLRLRRVQCRLGIFSFAG